MTMTTKRCPIFCRQTCTKHHHPLLIALINTNTTEAGDTSFTALEATISRYIKVMTSSSVLPMMTQTVQLASQFLFKLGKWSICDDINDPDPDYRYPLLHWAACLGKIAVVKWLVQRDKVCVFARHLTTYDTALHMVIHSLQKTCQKEASQVFSKLVTILAGSLACRNSKGDTPLHLACRSLLQEEKKVEYFSDCVNIILKFSSARGGGFPATIVNAQNNDGDTPVHIMAQKDRTLNVIKTMVEFGKVDLNLTNSKHQNALEVAIAQGQMKTSKYLNQLMENTPKKRNGSIVYVSNAQQPHTTKRSPVINSGIDNSASNTSKKNEDQRKAKKNDITTPALTCNVSSTEENTGESPDNDQCQNDDSRTNAIEEGASDRSSLANQVTSDSPSSTSSSLEHISIGSVHPHLGLRLKSTVPATKLTGKVLPNVCSLAPSPSPVSSSLPLSDFSTPVSAGPSQAAPVVPPSLSLSDTTSPSSVSSSLPSSDTSTSSLSGPSQAPSIVPSLSVSCTSSSSLSGPSLAPPIAPFAEPSSDRFLTTSSAFSSPSDNSCEPSPAKKKKVRVLMVKKGKFPTCHMVFTDQVQFGSKVRQDSQLVKSDKLLSKPFYNAEDTADCEPLSSVKIETDIAEDQIDNTTRVCPDSNTDSSPELMVTSVMSLSRQDCAGADRNGTAGPGSALIEYLSMCSDGHRLGILTVLNKDCNDYRKQKEELHNQIKGVEKEIQDGELEMEEKNNRLKDILLEVEQLQGRVFNLAKQSIGQKQTLRTLEASVCKVDRKLNCCEKAILDMS